MLVKNISVYLYIIYGFCWSLSERDQCRTNVSWTHGPCGEVNQVNSGNVNLSSPSEPSPGPGDSPSPHALHVLYPNACFKALIASSRVQIWSVSVYSLQNSGTAVRFGMLYVFGTRVRVTGEVRKVLGERSTRTCSQEGLRMWEAGL